MADDLETTVSSAVLESAVETEAAIAEIVETVAEIEGEQEWMTRQLADLKNSLTSSIAETLAPFLEVQQRQQAELTRLSSVVAEGRAKTPSPEVVEISQPSIPEALPEAPPAVEVLPEAVEVEEAPPPAPKAKKRRFL